MDQNLAFEKVGIALGLGLLVGLQRESVQSPLAGIRTFALITVFGAVAALLGLGLEYGAWIVGLGAVAVAAILVVGDIVKVSIWEVEPGITTEIAALLMYGVGAYLVVGHTAVGIALGGCIAVLLHFKRPMHAFVAKIGESDLRAIMQFVLITLVIFPVLPDEDYGPYRALNPHNIWLMVVLIVGISLGGYVAYKLLGQQSGALVGGILGGMISSTATTVSYGRRVAEAPATAPLAALVIVVATAVSLIRALTEIAVVAAPSFWALAPPLLALLALTLVQSGVRFLLSHKEKADFPEHGNPAELTAALIFAALYTVVVLAVIFAKNNLGDTGLYAVAVLSGLHDLDAITLSTARLVNQEHLDAALGWRAVLAAFLANLVMKAAIAGVLGGGRLLRAIAAPFAVALLAGAAILFLWP